MLYASWHHSDPHNPADYGLVAAALTSGVPGDWKASQKVLMTAPAGSCLNIESGKEVPDVTAARFEIASLARSHAKLRGTPPSVYGVSRTDFWPGLTNPLDSPLVSEKLRASAIAQTVCRVEADAYWPWPLAELTEARWKQYYQALQIHRERCNFLWRDARGVPLPIRWWVGNRNLQTEIMPPWIIKATADLLRAFIALGDSVVLFQGWDGTGRIRWDASDDAFVKAFTHTNGT